MTSLKKLLDREHGVDNDDHQARPIGKLGIFREIDYERAKWVSPIDSNKRRRLEEDRVVDPFAKCSNFLEFDCASSVISLDFGLVSPRRNWTSPPQRIERAQNREWSPHRVIDRPNPESSPGNWISMKESCQQSPAVDTKNTAIGPIATCPARSSSQNTYILTEKLNLPHEAEIQPTRKTSVLMDYNPDRDGGGDCGTAKSRVRNSKETIESHFSSSGDKVKRIVRSGGRVIKISQLEDFQVPSFGKIPEKNHNDLELENRRTEPPEKQTKSGLSLKSKAKNVKTAEGKKSPLASKKKFESDEEKESRTKNVEKEEAEVTEDKYEEEKENKSQNEQINNDTQKIIMDLENILRDKTEKTCDSVDKNNVNGEKPKSKKLFPVKFVEEKPPNIQKTKKRKIDPKVVQEFIKSQKQKRLAQIRTERKSKVEEKEAIKKKLEELRVKTLKLAAHSKKKKPPDNTIKIIEPNTEDDVTMSLGLKQVKPKVSYNESISNLKKKTLEGKTRINRIEVELTDDNEEPNDFENEEAENLKRVEQESKATLSLAQPLLKPPQGPTSLGLKHHDNLNSVLKKIAEALELKIREKEKKLQSKSSVVPSKSVKVSSAELVSKPSTKANENVSKDKDPQTVTVQLETIQSLKDDIRKISENFKILHEIIVEKTELDCKRVEKQNECIPKPSKVVEEPVISEKNPDDMPQWLKNFTPNPHPYNVYMAFRQKMNFVKSKSSSSVISQGSSSYATTTSNKYDSDFEKLSFPSDRLDSGRKLSQKASSISIKTTSDTTKQSYYSLKDSGSELSSSILDSDKQISNSVDANKQSLSIRSPEPIAVTQRQSGKSSITSITSSINTEIASQNLQLATVQESSAISKISPINFSQEPQNFILIPPDVKLITNDLGDKKLNNYSKNISLSEEKVCTPSKNSIVSSVKEKLNNSEGMSNKDQKTDSTITEIIDNLSENEKSQNLVKTTNEKFQNAVQKIDEAHIRRTFFQPEMLHLQFQAELTLLETFQQSLAQFLETERLKTLSEVNKIVYEKSVNTEKLISKEDQAIQTTFSKDELKTEESSETKKIETDSVKTEINVSEEEFIKSEIAANSKKETEVEGDKTSEISEKASTIEQSNDDEGSKIKCKEKDDRQKELRTPDFSYSHNGILFQMLDRMMKDEELRSEHQLALIRLREKTLNEKVKAELTFLEMKKRALKESGVEEEQNVSAIKKKQRGILMKYQSEKEEIERLKKMHKIASEERKIMIKQQKQIEQMQLSTKDMLIKLGKREKSPLKKNSLKPKTLTLYDSQSDIQEDIVAQLPDSVLTESICSVDDSTRNSNGSDLEVSSENVSEEESEILRRNTKTIENKVSSNLESSVKSKKLSAIEEEKFPRKKHSAEELLSWSKRLEEKENHLKDLERETIRSVSTTTNRLIKSHINAKICLRDRSTSPFQFLETYTSVTESSIPTKDDIELKKSSTTSEVIAESIVVGEATENADPVSEKLENSISEDIPVQYSKSCPVSTSRTLEYNSESFESPSSSEAPKNNPITPRKSVVNEGSYRAIPIKLSLSPRIQSSRRRYSSGSDDSLNFSHTETASEQSDLESRIAALHEQLKKRKLEAERLRREQKKAQRERLKVKEQSLIKQIQAYDAYIQQKKQELEQEYEHSFQTVSKPLIKQPKVAEKSNLKRQESLLLNENDKIKFYPRAPGKSKEKEEAISSPKITESDSEIQEQIQDLSESNADEIKTSFTNEEKSESVQDLTETKTKEIKTYTESGQDKSEIKEIIKSSKDEESLSKTFSNCIQETSNSINDETKSKMKTEPKVLESKIETESSINEISEVIKLSTASIESLPEPGIDLDGSLSESEDRSISVKTTLHSPEKENMEETESKEVTEFIDKKEETTNTEAKDNTYQSDSFESDFEEATSSKESKTQKESESSEIETAVSGEGTQSYRLDEEEEKEEEEEEEDKEEVETERDDIEEENFVEKSESNAEENDLTSPFNKNLVRLPETKTETSKESNDWKISTQKVDIISNSVVSKLLTESLKIFSDKKLQVQKKMEEESTLNLEILTNSLMSEIADESIDDTLKIYNRKSDSKSREKKPISSDKITSDVRQRISEIMSQAGGVKEFKPPQDMLVTTYDVSPRETQPEVGEKTDSIEKEEFLRSLISTPKEDKSDEIFSQSESNRRENKDENFGQEWFDDDFGLSRTRREAEELRLQQLQIEQEIQQLQAQQEQIPYFYLREIPNKPPPPYTPPGKPPSEIPTSEADVLAVTSLAVRIVVEEMEKGKLLDEIEPARSYYGNVVSEHVKTYKFFLFDLVKHLIEEVFRRQEETEKDVLPWTKTRELLSAYKYRQIDRTLDGLNEFVQKQVLVLFGFGKRFGQESLMMRCFKKKRDHVDEILVCESQEEESQWTQFDEDQVTVKNEVALAILDNLLEESTLLVKLIFNKKTMKLK